MTGTPLLAAVALAIAGNAFAGDTHLHEESRGGAGTARDSRGPTPAPAAMGTSLAEAVASDEGSDSLRCLAGGFSIALSVKDGIAWSDPSGKKGQVGFPSVFQGAGIGSLQKLWCGLVDGDVVVVYFGTFFGGEGDFIGQVVARIGLVGGRLIWAAEAAGNAGPPLRLGRILYVSGMGFVGKIDMKSGHYLWQHRGMYRSPGLYSGFQRPRRDGARVVFPAINHNVPSSAGWPSALVVDDATGEIVAGAPPEIPSADRKKSWPSGENRR